MLDRMLNIGTTVMFQAYEYSEIEFGTIVGHSVEFELVSYFDRIAEQYGDTGRLYAVHGEQPETKIIYSVLSERNSGCFAVPAKRVLSLSEYNRWANE